MAKKVYIGVNNVARKVKKIYIGVDGKARKVKKGYIGVGGVARPFWTGGELAYYGTITKLSVGRYGLAATPVGDYALFGGGYNLNDEYPQSIVDSYSKSLTRSTPTALSVARGSLSAATVGSYALFAGGYHAYYDDGGNLTSSGFNTVDAYNTSLTRSKPTQLSFPTYGMAPTAIGDYALFAGGVTDAHGAYTKVYAYNKSLTQSSPTALHSDIAGAGHGVTVGNYGVIAEDYGKTISAYNASLTKSDVTWTTALYGGYATAAIGNYALFAGGSNATAKTFYTTVRWCNASLTQGTLATGLSQARRLLTGTTVGEYAVFGGGSLSGSHSYSAVVDAYDKSLTRTVQQSLNAARIGHGAVTVGDYALFAGGRGGSYGATSYDVVDAYTVA